MSSAVPGAAPNLVAMRDSLRRDLHDPAGERWADDVLERHILRAVAEYSQAFPDPQTAALTATPGSRDLSIAGLADLVRIDAVEYPIGLYPRSFAGWQAWDQVLTLLIDAAPAAADPVTVHWGSAHACTTAACTIPTPDIDLVLTGAAGYAAQEWAAYATNRVNVDRTAVEHYATLAQRNLDHFHVELARRPRRSRLVRRALTAPAETIPAGDTVQAPS